jgi:hypothetical protein
MESFGTLNGDERDSILELALQHAGGQFGVMQEELGNLHGENCLLCEDNTQLQLLLCNALTALISWINNHRKVRRMDTAHAQMSKDHLGYVLVLVYLAANLTCWTTHCIAFMQLFHIEDALRLAVMQNRGAIVVVQVGATKGTDKVAFTAEAHSFCESLIEDIEPICYGTNINQKDLTRVDQVLLSLVGMFLRMVEHPEPEFAKGMVECLEKRWKDSDQLLFCLR